MQVAEHLTLNHVELDRLFDNVRTSLDVGQCGDLYQKLDLFWAHLAMHIWAEHRCLFPAIRMICQASEGSSYETDLKCIPRILGKLRCDHDFFMHELARAIKAMRLTFYFGNDTETLVVVRDILEAVKLGLETHNLIEEENIYRLTTDRYLKPEQITELSIAIQKELNNYPHRFTVNDARIDD